MICLKLLSINDWFETFVIGLKILFIDFILLSFVWNFCWLVCNFCWLIWNFNLDLNYWRCNFCHCHWSETSSVDLKLLLIYLKLLFIGLKLLLIDEGFETFVIDDWFETFVDWFLLYSKNQDSCCKDSWLLFRFFQNKPIASVEPRKPEWSARWQNEIVLSDLLHF